MTQPIRNETPPPPAPLRPAAALPSNRPAIILLHGDDFTANDHIPPGADIRAVVIAASGHSDHPWPFGRHANRFVASLAADTANRLTRDGKNNVHIIDALQADALRRHCDHNHVRTLVTTEAPVGPLPESLQHITRELEADGIEIVPPQRR